MKLRAPALSLALWAALYGGPARASVWDYLKGYQLGVDYSKSGGASTLFYDAAAPEDGSLPKGCAASKRDGQMSCQAVISSATAQGYGFFLEQTFKRTGWTYFKADIRFAYFGLDASLDKTAEENAEQPLQSASIRLRGLNTEGYLKLGVTPLYVPDVLFSLGLGAQAGTGAITVEGQKQKVDLVVPHLFSQLEVVWIRIGRLSLSSYASVEADAGQQAVYDKPIHAMSRFAIAQSSAAFGLAKLVLPLP